MILEYFLNIFKIKMCFCLFKKKRVKLKLVLGSLLVYRVGLNLSFYYLMSEFDEIFQKIKIDVFLLS